MTTCDYRAALKRLIELNEDCTKDVWTHAIAAARAALAEPEPPVEGEVAKLPSSDHFAGVSKMVEPADGEVAELVRRLRDFMTVPLLQERVRVADLLERLAEPDPVGPSDEEIEGVARLIYRAMQDATAQLTPDWTECGNSEMQDRARGAARAVLARRGENV